MASKTAKKQFISPIFSDLIQTKQRVRQHRKKTKNIKPAQTKINVKTPKKNYKSKVPTKEVLDNNAVEKEYYPNRLKRNLNAKKILLKPKYNMKVIGSTNKRKITTPQRGDQTLHDYLYEIKNSQDIGDTGKSLNKELHGECQLEVSMAEVINAMEETNNLTDEDLLEILTCPSPVWWEDPPNLAFDEDAICTMPKEEPVQNTNKSTEHTSHTPTAANLIDFEQQINNFKITTPKFTNKKKKLEEILGNLKKRSHQEDKKNDSAEEEDIFSDISMNEEDILRDLENISIPIENDINSPVVNDTNEISEKNDIINSQFESFKTDLVESENMATLELIPKANAADEFKNNVAPKSLKNNELLVNNEQNTLNSNTKTMDKLLECSRYSTDTSVVETRKFKQRTNENMATIHLITNNNSSIQNSKNKPNELPLDIKNYNKTSFIKVRSDLIKIDSDIQIVPNELPPLKRRPVENVKEESKSLDSFDNSDFDTISDTNVRFISDDDSSITDELSLNSNLSLSDKNVDEIYEQITGKNEFPKRLMNDLTEYITVYKIMSNEDLSNQNDGKIKLESSKISENFDGKLNVFFKKCKNNKRLRKDYPNAIDGDKKNTCVSVELKSKSDIDSGEIKIKNEKVTSVGKTDDEQNRLNGCDYCIIQSDRGAIDFSCDSCNMATYSCDLCNFRANTKNVIRNHVSSCKNIDDIPWKHSYVLNQT